MTDWSLQSLQEHGSQFLLGGVSSNFRNNPYTGLPMYLSSADGAHITDVSGKTYIDFFMGHGAVLLGHNRPAIANAITRALKDGFTAEFDNVHTIELARRICDIIPCAERVRFTNSGSEATLLAMRLARGYTGREKIVRIDGHFHGVHDYVLFNNLAGLRDRKNPGDRPSEPQLFSRGIPAHVINSQIIIPWNDADIFAAVAEEGHDEIAAILMNPIDYNNGCMTTDSEYLARINDIAHRYGILVIYDEILSGFRTGLSCAQGFYAVTPDICLLGKALSNGVPLAAIAGKKDIMLHLQYGDPPIVHGGTFSGNLLGVHAAHASLDIMSDSNFYPNLFKTADYFFEQLQKLYDDHNIPARVQSLGSNFFIYFGTRDLVASYEQMQNLDRELEKKILCACIEKGVYFHTDFTVSAQHTKVECFDALERIDAVLGNF